MSMREAEAWLADRRGQCFDVVLRGSVFGGRYGESSQEIEAATSNGDELHIKFRSGLALEVVRPLDIALESNGLFVRVADEIRFAGSPVPETSPSTKYALALVRDSSDQS